MSCSSEASNVVDDFQERRREYDPDGTLPKRTSARVVGICKQQTMSSLRTVVSAGISAIHDDHSMARACTYRFENKELPILVQAVAIPLHRNVRFGNRMSEQNRRAKGHQWSNMGALSSAKGDLPDADVVWSYRNSAPSAFSLASDNKAISVCVRFGIRIT